MLSALIALGLVAVNGVRAILIRDTIKEWFWLSSIATDDLLYITGGEFYEPDDTGTLQMYYQANTLIVDLTQSWTNQTVSATSVTDADGMIYVRQPMLFYDKPRNKISRFGGWPYEESDFPSILWSFTAGTNNANWQNETSPSVDGLSANSPAPFASANTYTNTTYYNFGGNVMNQPLPDMTVLSGLVTRDFVAQDWTNSTANLPKQSNYRTQARMAHAPNFGDDGYLVMVGGESPPTEASQYETGSFMTDMATISLFDISTQTWYTQKATGDIPPPRSEFCAVGAVSTGGGKHYDLFVYGGSTNSTADLNGADDEGYLNVYVLSLPAFRWFKSNATTSVRRAAHSCSVIGNRQMISIGGRQPSSLDVLGAQADPWAGGLGVFDMTALEWVDHYDAAAAKYVSPDIVKSYYNSSYVTPDFSDTALATAFAFTPPAGSNSSDNSTSPDSSGGSSSKSSTSVGAIVGGVVGGIAVLAAILFAVWFCLRRRRKQKRSNEVDSENEATRLSTYDRKPSPSNYEAASNPVFEADDGSRSELMDASNEPKSRHHFFAELPADEEHQRLAGGMAQRTVR